MYGGLSAASNFRNALSSFGCTIFASPAVEIERVDIMRINAAL